jgi:hypothetical protein
MGPPVRAAPAIAGQILARMGRYPEAIAELRRNPRGSIALLGHTLARAGQRDEATRILADLRARWESGRGDAFSVATVYAGLGDLDATFAWLDRAFEERSLRLAIFDPTFDELRADPRFRLLARRLGVPST